MLDCFVVPPRNDGNMQRHCEPAKQSSGTDFSAAHTPLTLHRAGGLLIMYSFCCFFWIASSFLLAMTMRVDRHCEERSNPEII